jgi:hypothetical protein
MPRYSDQPHNIKPDGYQSRTPYPNDGHRQSFHKSHTSLGATGHWVRTAGMLAPVVIGELIEDPMKRWRAIRLAAVATTLVSEAMWTHKIRKERQETRELESPACMPL